MGFKWSLLIIYNDLSPWLFSVLTKLLRTEMKNTESMWYKEGQDRGLFMRFEQEDPILYHSLNKYFNSFYLCFYILNSRKQGTKSF